MYSPLMRLRIQKACSPLSRIMLLECVWRLSSNEYFGNVVGDMGEDGYLRPSFRRMTSAINIPPMNSTV